MRAEAGLWLEQARRDLDAAKHLKESHDWFASVFWCHQVAEKALKALLIASGRAARGYNLLELARLAENELGIKTSRDVLRCIRYLNPHYMISRYPDAANGYTRRRMQRKLSDVLWWF